MSEPPPLLGGLDERLQAMLGTLVGQAPVGVGVMSPDLRFLLVNQALADMNGFPVEDHLGRSIAELLPAMAAEAEPRFREVLETGEPLIDWRLEGETPAQPGVPRSWSENLYRIDLSGGETVGVAIIVTETTERRNEGARLLAFAEFAQALALSVHTADVADAVRTHLATSFGASFANLALLEPRSGQVQLVNPRDLDHRVAERYLTVPLDAPTPLTDAIRNDETVIVEDLAANARRYPALLEDTEAAGLVATASVPFEIEGEARGAIGLGWARPIETDPQFLAQLTTIAKLTAETLARTRTYDAHAAFIVELQKSMLPVGNPASGLDVAVRYQAAGTGLGFGGDWYDVIPLDDARTAVVVGDVVGHGIEAAATMVLVRSAINAVVQLGTPLADIFAVAGPVINALTSTYIGTAVVMIVDTEARSIRYSSAGHPPILLVLPDGTTQLLEDAVDAEDPEYQLWGQRAFGVLQGAVADLARQKAPDLDLELAAALCWSTVQGLITTHQPLQAMAERNGRAVPDIGELAEQLTRMLVDGWVGLA